MTQGRIAEREEEEAGEWPGREEEEGLGNTHRLDLVPSPDTRRELIASLPGTRFHVCVMGIMLGSAP